MNNFTPSDSTTGLPDWIAQLTPSIRAMIFVAEQSVDIDQAIKIRDLSIVKEHSISEAQTRVLIGKVTRPPWWFGDKRNTDFEQAVYELIVIYWDTETKLLFVNSSFENERLFEKLARCLAEKVRPLPLFHVQRVFAGVSNARFVNVGMRHRMIGKHSEAYRMLTGPDAHLAITRTDARTHVKGHAFGTGDFGNGLTSLGFTDSGKIWSPNKTSNLQELIGHFKALAKRIVSTGYIISNSELDNLSAGEMLGSIPDDIIAVAWSEVVYQRTYKLENVPLSDWDIRVDRESSTESLLRVVVSYETSLNHVNFRSTYPHFSYAYGQGPVNLNRGDDFVDFLNMYPPRFFTSTQIMISGSIIYHPMTKLPPFKIEKMNVQQWSGVDIESEVTSSANGISIHKFVENVLRRRQFDYLIYDHGSGEVADYIAVEDAQDVIRITFYHIKASSNSNAGYRVDDLYEVCGQAVKSVQWLKILDLLDRICGRTNSKFIIGDRAKFKIFVSDFMSKPISDEFHLVIVQPGVSKANISEQMLVILAATEDYIRRVGEADLEVWSSA